ncbi:MAG TPA: tRNA (5-methylaminomethyl-2-thiouridine)(34)-methyltransferase MnmD [Chitinophagales bacterium]|nr:tRNA (5-methylaminomethyl-2-thiouridine)(34)-methyltransferase MnmD [Chitinophagales bacterium]
MQIITTSDGSHTLFSEQFNEIYHSRHGAIQESQHVFIKNGFDYLLQQGVTELSIFEVGFGTGLNAWLTLMEAAKAGLPVTYHTIELYPVSIDLIKELNYPALIENEKYRPPFHSMHLCTWDEEHEITPFFKFKKINASLLNYTLPIANCQLIYFDAFAPEHQPEMWTAEIMQKMYDILQPGGTLVSYCSKSLFQRALKQAGFSIEKLPGPPGKREMVRAIKV